MPEQIMDRFGSLFDSQYPFPIIGSVAATIINGSINVDVSISDYISIVGSPNYILPIVGSVRFSNTLPLHVSGTFLGSFEMSNPIQAGTNVIGSAAIFSSPAYKSEIFTALATGTQINHSNNIFDNFSLLVSGIGGTVPTWDMRLEGAIDGSTFYQIIQHTNTDGTNVTKHSISAINSLYTRSRVAGITGGGSLSVIWVGGY